MSAAVTTDETLVIETPERVPLHFALASIGNRFLACAIDHLIQLLAVVIIIILSMLTLIGGLSGAAERLWDAPKWTLALLFIAYFLIWSGYFALFEWAWAGQTPGKRWLRLRVIREDGRPITFYEAAARNLVRIFDMMPAVPLIPLYSVGLVSVFISSRDQRVGDLVAGTVVVREREAQAPTFEQADERRGSAPHLQARPLHGRRKRPDRGRNRSGRSLSAPPLGPRRDAAPMDGLAHRHAPALSPAPHLRPRRLHLRGLPRRTAPSLSRRSPLR
jgi:uncharacterized RDD family membrane protein YckC